MGDLKQTCKDRLIEMVRSVRPKSGWKVLIVDQASLRIISASCRMHDIMEEGITLVENINISRQPLPQMEAIYFLSPSPESISALIKDFENPKEPQYGVVHLFFTSPLKDEEFSRLKQENVVSRIKTLKEMNLDFIAYEMQVFHLDDLSSFTSLFSPESVTSKAEQHRIAEKIVSVCVTLREYPIIRYNMNKENKNSVSHSLACIVQDKLDNLIRKSVEFSSTANITGNRALLLILDRSHDPMAPLLHEFTYQAMIYDLLKIENDKYVYTSTTNTGEQKSKEALLSESDPLWSTLRHMHIADAITWILDGFNAFVKENKVVKLRDGEKFESLKEMSDAMKAMPQYKEMLEKYSLHINMTQHCMAAFNERHLSKIAAIEQDMAIGEDAEGKPTKNIISSMSQFLTDSSVNDIEKLRLLMIYLISQEGIKDSDRRRLFDLAKISIQDQAAVTNLRYLGVTLSKGPKNKGKQQQKPKEKKKKRDDAPSFELSRFVNNVKVVGEEFLANSLSPDEYPFVKESPSSMKEAIETPSSSSQSLRKATQPKWAEKGKRKSEKTTPISSGARVIIFIAGGMTFSEMRSAYELAQKHKREVIIGSTHMLTPTMYVESLKSLHKMDQLDD